MREKRRIVFYSYKGGTGSTLALANVASYLARFGFKVCIIDMDLEAPGIHYKFLVETDSRINEMLGMVDYISYFIENKTVPADLNPYLININDNVTIMPSGNISCKDYWDKLSRINWRELLYEKKSPGVKLLFDLLGRIESDEFSFDYILIDSRAGITPLSGICTSLFGDVLAAFFSASPESLYGTRQMLRNIRETRKNDKLPDMPIISVLTRYEKFDDEESYVAEKMDFLNDGEKPLYAELCVIHADRDIERKERIIYGSRENNEENQPRLEMPIRLDYLNFFQCLIDDTSISNRLVSLVKKITANHSIINEPDRVQSEVEALAAVYGHRVILEELIKIYHMRNIHANDQNKFLNTIARYYEAGGEEKVIKSWYFDAFLEYNQHNNNKFRFDFKKIYETSENASPDSKMELARILLKFYGDEHYQKEFELFKDLLQYDQYSLEACKNIMSLFIKRKDLYHANTDLLPDLNDPRLKDAKNSAFRDTVYSVYSEYCSPEGASELLNNPDVYNHMKHKEPLRLMRIFYITDKIDHLEDFAKWQIEHHIENGNTTDMIDLIKYSIKNGFGLIIQNLLPKNNKTVEFALSIVKNPL